MRDPLHGIRLKLQRAQQQLQALHADIAQFMQGNPYRAKAEYNPARRELRLITQIAESPPGVWGVQCGEIVHNLRSSLDHLIWELVIHETKAPPTANRTQFPIFEAEIGYRQRSPQYLAGVGSNARALIEALQPFRAGESTSSPLWHLLKLSDFDKHRTLHLVGASLQAAEIKFEGLTPDTDVEARATLGPLMDGKPFLTLHFPGTDTPFVNPEDVKMHGPLGIGIAFDEGSPVVAGQGVVETLGRIGQRVHENVEGIARDILGVELVI